MVTELRNKLDSCLIADRHRIAHQIRNLQRLQQRGEAIDELRGKIEQQLHRSVQRAEERRALLPVPTFPEALPITARLDEIRALIRDNQVIILCGETGSGKSTQLPKVCLSLGRGVLGRIGHTQPRRIAARSLASRIASELGQEVGDSVGFKVRFHDNVSKHSHIKLMTDGMLLAEVQRDKFLNEYDTLIIDEAHERSLNIDFLLGYLKKLLPRRPDLKVIITSATIDPARFSEFFSGAPVIEVSGRTFPVEVRYKPPSEESNERGDALQQALIEAVDELSRESRGDILVFLSGEREIRETAENLRKHHMAGTEVLPLFARLGTAEQTKIFHPSGQHRIVLATNVAETSLTVPGIRHVIDAGYARISRYSPRSKIQRLPVERISRASADQRKGRCGRVAEGICIRLYEQDEFESRVAFTEPEIQRTNLASVILQLTMLGFGTIEEFPFIDPPDARLIKDGYRVLEEITAVDGLRKITKLGSKLARLPVDPRVGRMLLEAAHTGCLQEVLVIAAALSVQDARDRPMDKQKLADEAHAVFKDEESDFVSYLNLWRFIEEKRRHLTRRKFQRLCREHFLSIARVQEWHDIHRQLRLQMHELGYKENTEAPGYDTLHSAILSGLLSHAGLRQSGKGKGYLGARNSNFQIFPGSGLFAPQPKWVVAAELVETTRLYARGVAQIQPAWLERLAGHLVKRTYAEPHWQAKRGQVGAYETVSLYGLPLAARRRVNFGPVNPVEAREIFIRFALVEGDFHTRANFWRHNQELIAAIHDLEARSRRRDIMVDDQALYAFYDKHVPAGIYSKPQFEQWTKTVVKENSRLLYMDREDVMLHRADTVSANSFPDSLSIASVTLPLQYQFEPGNSNDGVTLVVPGAVLNQLAAGSGDWLVPGLLKEKITALIKGLPKSLRKNFVPVPDYAERCMQVLVASDTPLIQILAKQLKDWTGVHIPEDAWRPDLLPDHLRLSYQVIDGSGKQLAASSDLAGLQQQFSDTTFEAQVSSHQSDITREGLKDWDFEQLPVTVETSSAGMTLQAWPALVDAGDSVAIQLLGSHASATLAHNAGLRRLIRLQLPQQIRFLRKSLTGLSRMQLQYAKVAGKQGKGTELEASLISAIIDRAFLDGQPEIRDKVAFNQRLEMCRGSLTDVGEQLTTILVQILDQYQQARVALGKATQIHWLESVRDMQQQLDALVYQGFLLDTPLSQMLCYPRYLKSVTLRLDKLRHAVARDQQAMREMGKLYADWRQRFDKHPSDERLQEMRWMFEELRVSLFTQELKTAYPISLKRVKKRWEALGL